MISRVKGHIVAADVSTPEAVQVTADTFIDTKYLVAEDFMNHSCEPNVWLNLEERKFIAARTIRSGEELTFNYLTTEWDMATHGTDFDCVCGSKKCFGQIRGFRFLATKERNRLPYQQLSPFLQSKIGAKHVS